MDENTPPACGPVWGILPLLISLTGGVFAQLPWSTPQLLCDSTGDNRHPSFARNYSDISYNILVWERAFADRSRIFLKSFMQPDSEIAVSPDSAGCFARHPTAAFLEYTYPEPPVLIVWQSNQSGNIDLYSVEYFMGQFQHFQRITTHPEDDLNPDLVPGRLVWERQGNIYFSAYSAGSSSWGPEEPVDTSNCYHPRLSIYNQSEVVYEKRTMSGTRIRHRINNFPGGWSDPEDVFTTGDNRSPTFVTGVFEGLLWAHSNGGDWNIIHRLPWSNDTSLFVFSAADEIHPCGVEVPLITDDFHGPMFLAFQSDSAGNWEIYTHHQPYEPAGCFNISRHPGPDSLPVFSLPAWQESQFLDLRYWLVWESLRNGRWQIRGSFTEIAVSTIDESLPQAGMTFYLHQNYPNPFNSITHIRFDLSISTMLEISIYDLMGRKVRTLLHGYHPAGIHSVFWDGRDENRREVSSGLYLCRLSAGRRQETRKILLLR